MAWKIKIFLIAPLILLICIGICHRVYSPDEFNFASALEKIGPVTPIDIVALHMSIEWALDGSAFEDRYVVNERSSSESLNIFVFDSSLDDFPVDKELRILKNNAVFIEEHNLISLDYQIIDSLSKRYYDGDEILSFQSHIIAWIIGHEVGHLELHKGTSHLENDFNIYSKFKCFQNKEEFEADSLFARKIYETRNFTVDNYIRFFTLFLDKEIKSPTTLSTIDNLLRTLFPKCTHPQYIQRAYRFLDQIANLTGDTSLLNKVDRYKQVLISVGS